MTADELARKIQAAWDQQPHASRNQLAAIAAEVAWAGLCPGRPQNRQPPGTWCFCGAPPKGCIPHQCDGYLCAYEGAHVHSDIGAGQ